ncbi:M4 family metallopeptidase [Pseudoalteromonas sp. MMG013]|uniref:M4 family metallopeptidase n=1 Tax=Pseudoalteromonas sp. MMG013 TaxID=2822687 RepID=UPI001B37D089|nr:M4 family metallopeptidase [Pseudoalteromonas sp. MMG013]MBQ4863939.1 M4 family metallopeptidase [Pseudoalteromonas sp. MMG013]
MNTLSISAISGLMSIAFGSHAIEQQNLMNQSHIWAQVQKKIVQSNMALKAEKSLSELTINYRAMKTVGANNRYQHYQVYVGNIPVLNSRFVLLVDKLGDIEQGLGSAIIAEEEFATSIPDIFRLTETQIKHTLTKQFIADGIPFTNELSFSKAFMLDENELQAVFVARVHTPERRVNFIINAETLKVIRKDNDIDGLNPQAELIAGGGIGGNEKLGAVCYSPAPMSMNNCLSYKFQATDVAAAEVLFTDNNVSLFSAFSGYPFIVTKEQGNCALENPYVKTIDYIADKTKAASYQCSNSNENFDKETIDNQYYDYYSYSGLNDAHFNAGLVMQYYHQLLTEMFPDQGSTCEATGFCLKQLLQNVGNNTYGNSQANWDDTHVNYGTGNYGGTHYYHTTLDIVAHEVSHAVTFWNSQLNASGQDGALNEAFSDIASVAVFDYFSQYVRGSYRQSTAFKNKSVDQVTSHDGNRKWWYGWDVLYEDTGARYFEMPSWDGKSIDHFKSYEPSQSIYSTAGVFRKAFYELVKTQGWSIQDGFKLFLRANVNCFFTGASVQDAGMCLIDQARFFSHIGTESEVTAQIDNTLHSVGIVANNTQLSSLEFDSAMHYDTVSYTLNSIAATDIKEIEVEWGDGTNERWQKSNNSAIHPFLQRSRVLDIDELIRFKLTVTKTDSTKLVGFRHYFSRAVKAACAPTLAQGNSPLSSLSINAQSVPLAHQPYQSVLTPTLLMNKHSEQQLQFDNTLNGKLVSVLFDNNRDGLFSSNELIIENQVINNGQVRFKLKDQTTAGIGLMRLSFGGKYTFYDTCGYAKASQVIDVKTDVDVPELPIQASFSYQLLANNQIKFINTSQVNKVRQPSYYWQFGHDNQTSHNEQPETVSYPLTNGTYRVSLRVTYQDGSGQTDGVTQDIILTAPSECKSRITTSNNAQALYIDEMHVWTSIHNRNLIANASGTNSTGYKKHATNLEFLRRAELNVDIKSNVLNEATIDRLLSRDNRDVRFTVWVDQDKDKVFRSDESNSFDMSGNYTKDCNNGQCRIKASQAIFLPSMYSWQKKNFTLRVRLEEHPLTEFGHDGCNNFNYGEVEDMEITVKGR